MTLNKKEQLYNLNFRDKANALNLTSARYCDSKLDANEKLFNISLAEKDEQISILTKYLEGNRTALEKLTNTNKLADYFDECSTFLKKDQNTSFYDSIKDLKDYYINKTTHPHLDEIAAKYTTCQESRKYVTFDVYAPTTYVTSLLNQISSKDLALCHCTIIENVYELSSQEQEIMGTTLQQEIN